MRKFLTLTTVAGLLVAGSAGVAASSASAAGLSPVVADCNAHGRLTRHYTVTQLRSALATIPADIAEYTDCHDVIQHQLLVQLGKLPGNGGSGQGGGSFLPTWLIVVLAILVVAAGGFGVLALRNRRGGGADPALD
jgi:hypothetical protein